MKRVLGDSSSQRGSLLGVHLVALPAFRISLSFFLCQVVLESSSKVALGGLRHDSSSISSSGQTPTRASRNGDWILLLKYAQNSHISYGTMAQERFMSSTTCMTAVIMSDKAGRPEKQRLISTPGWLYFVEARGKKLVCRFSVSRSLNTE